MTNQELMKQIPRGPKNGEPQTPRLSEIVRLLTFFTFNQSELKIIERDIDAQRATIAAKSKRATR